MNRHLVFLLLSSLLLAACSHSSRTQYASEGRFGYRGEVGVDPEAQPQPTPEPDSQYLAPAPSPTPTVSEVPSSDPTPTPLPLKRESVYGIPVPGRPGYVSSPFVPNSGLIDVRGYPPGTEVKDPYTQNRRTFLVP